MTNLQKAIAAATLINTLFNEYKAGELNSTGEKVRKKCAKFMRQRANSNRQDFLIAVKKTDDAWRNTIDHFLKENMKIEAKTTIAAIYNYFDSEMQKFLKLTEKQMEQFTIMSTSDAEAEANSSTVVDYLVEQMGFKKRKSAFAGKRLIIKGNLITDGKKIAEGF